MYTLIALHTAAAPHTHPEGATVAVVALLVAIVWSLVAGKTMGDW